MTRGSKKILDPQAPRSPGRHRAGRADQVRPVGPARELEAARATDEAVAADLVARGGGRGEDEAHRGIYGFSIYNGAIIMASDCDGATDEALAADRVERGSLSQGSQDRVQQREGAPRIVTISLHKMGKEAQGGSGAPPP